MLELEGLARLSVPEATPALAAWMCDRGDAQPTGAGVTCNRPGIDTGQAVVDPAVLHVERGDGFNVSSRALRWGVLLGTRHSSTGRPLISSYFSCGWGEFSRHIGCPTGRAVRARPPSRAESSRGNRRRP